MKIAITGGTGTIGGALAKSISGENEITIFSRNEAAQVGMKSVYPAFGEGTEYHKYRYIIGDVRDEDAIMRACEGMDYVFHFAALKHVEICEEQPMEAVKTNVVGTMNVINACYRHGAKLINMSSDKAINPVNVYGKTKSLAEDMVTKAGYLSIRSGNVAWSAGSVLSKWKEQCERLKNIELTSKDMTRFFVRIEDLIDFIWKSRLKLGVVTIPMQSFRLYDLAKECSRRFGHNDDSKIEIVGIRPGERLHEFRNKDTSSEDCIGGDLNYIFKNIGLFR